MNLLEQFSLYWAAVGLADENRRITAEAKTAIADIQAEANEALKQLAGIWREHCNGLEFLLKDARGRLKEADLGRSLADAHVNSLKAKLSESQDALTGEEDRHASTQAKLDQVESERNDANRQLQKIRAAFESLRAAVHPAQAQVHGGWGVTGGPGGGIGVPLGGGGILGGYGNPSRALGAGPGWLSSLDG